MIKKNILIVTSEFPPQPGGIGNHAYNLALYLAENDYAVTVIADQRDVDATEERRFDGSLPFRVKRISMRSLRFLMYIQRIITTFKEFRNTDVVIATGKFSLWNVAFGSLCFKRKTMAVIHGTEVNFKSAWLKRSIDLSLQRFDQIVAVSHYTKSLVSHLNKDVQVIPNGISISDWKLPQSRTKLKGSPVLTTVGRVSSRKGQLNVIQQLPELLKHFPELHYHCVGIPTEADDFMVIAQSLGVEDYITFHGSVSEERLKQVLQATDIFVMLSSESRSGDVEGFGIAILEANAMGVPAIGSKGCGIEDAVLDGASGFLISNESDIEFKNAINRIMASPINFKQEALKWANQHSWSTIIKRYEELIEN
ncbi:phosphatidylinositol alpha-1,6-mannosyltransferase [Winogradskyella epiphytica]|uniref:Phosphatidylinositol alpha-1,6-mannosyltransferase n=1 Tax=Winogradskyella epiphytica TaxID=262005 RepID=A0A2V4XH15_9FLAO|nr:phosphatidylinositol alpha-1,6-mannosyltransferase [Winogradskyella epiphytica]